MKSCDQKSRDMESCDRKSHDMKSCDWKSRDRKSRDTKSHDKKSHDRRDTVKSPMKLTKPPNLGLSAHQETVSTRRRS